MPSKFSDALNLIKIYPVIILLFYSCTRTKYSSRYELILKQEQRFDDSIYKIKENSESGISAMDTVLIKNRELLFSTSFDNLAKSAKAKEDKPSTEQIERNSIFINTMELYIRSVDTSQKKIRHYYH